MSLLVLLGEPPSAVVAWLTREPSSLEFPLVIAVRSPLDDGSLVGHEGMAAQGVAARWPRVAAPWGAMGWLPRPLRLSPWIERLGCCGRERCDDGHAPVRADSDASLFRSGDTSWRVGLGPTGQHTSAVISGLSARSFTLVVSPDSGFGRSGRGCWRRVAVPSGLVCCPVSPGRYAVVMVTPFSIRAANDAWTKSSRSRRLVRTSQFEWMGDGSL